MGLVWDLQLDGLTPLIFKMLSYFNMVVPKLFDLTLGGGSMGGGGAGTGGRARPRGWVGELLAYRCSALSLQHISAALYIFTIFLHKFYISHQVGNGKYRHQDHNSSSSSMISLKSHKTSEII